MPLVPPQTQPLPCHLWSMWLGMECWTNRSTGFAHLKNPLHCVTHEHNDTLRFLPPRTPPSPPRPHSPARRHRRATSRSTAGERRRGRGRGADGRGRRSETSSRTRRGEAGQWPRTTRGPRGDAPRTRRRGRPPGRARPRGRGTARRGVARRGGGRGGASRRRGRGRRADVGGGRRRRWPRGEDGGHPGPMCFGLAKNGAPGAKIHILIHSFEYFQILGRAKPISEK